MLARLPPVLPTKPHPGGNRIRQTQDDMCGVGAQRPLVDKFKERKISRIKLYAEKARRTFL